MTEAHYSDGTTFQGSVNYGPPPIAPHWDSECHELIIDPIHYVWVTEHFKFSDGTEGHIVLPFDRDPVTHEVKVDITDIVKGKAGETWTTWNIGTGKTTSLSFDCVVHEPTTTTTEEATTTTSTTVQKVCCASQVSATTSTTQATTASTLPFTGSHGTGPTAAIGGGSLLVGSLLLALATNFWRRTRGA